MNSTSTPRSSLKTGRNRQFLSESERMMREFTKRNDEFASGEAHHIIKFKPNKGSGNRTSSIPPTQNDGSEKRGAISKARQAIKKRLSKKEKDGSRNNNSNSNNKKRSQSKSRSYAVEKGIEASIKFDRNETFLNKTIPKTLSKLKTASTSSFTRGRSLERRKSFGGASSSIGQSLRRSLSMKRSKSLKRPLSMNHRTMSVGRSRSFSRGRSSPHTPGFLEKVKSFRRDRSILSVRSGRSNFSVRSNGRRQYRAEGGGNGGGNRFMRFFRRRKNQKEPPLQEKIIFVQQVYTPQTVPVDDEEVGFLDGLLCTSLDMTVCRDLFCRVEDVNDLDLDHNPLSNEDDIRDFGEEYRRSNESFERSEELVV